MTYQGNSFDEYIKKMKREQRYRDFNFLINFKSGLSFWKRLRILNCFRLGRKAFSKLIDAHVKDTIHRAMSEDYSIKLTVPKGKK